MDGSSISPQALTWSIAALATAGVILRPFRWPEAVWALAGAGALVLLHLLSWQDAWAGIAKGLDVYLFLGGMMLLSECARKEGLFDWLAAFATEWAKGSASRLFLLVYAVGTAVTVFLSNDATAVVLTPAVAAAVRAARVTNPLPYLYVCAFVANAASFVLPISNPANLVVFGGGHMPPLGGWLRMFLLPSILAIGATFLVLRLCMGRSLAAETVATDVERPSLSQPGQVAAGGLGLTVAALLAASYFGLDLGWPTLACGLATALLVVGIGEAKPLAILRGVSWGVLPLVAGLFVLVEALDRTGVIRLLADALRSALAVAPRETAAGSGILVAIASNLVNNLPAGLVAASALQASGAPPVVAGAVLIGIDLGPNFSITGSLATILWLVALRREGHHVGAWAFLKLGLLVTPPALILAIGAFVLTAGYF